MSEKRMYKIGLDKTDSNGAFSCPYPYCGLKIDPNNEDKEAYEVVDVKMSGEEIESLTVDCKKCGSETKLICLPPYPQA
ncbi:MAG: hypothetical protein GTN36_06310 [Candidatus Aenigmarchaeota archaeon]|nr:hypothetical protein [Candidatus Aenigmarchaeota archaeon]